MKVVNQSYQILNYSAGHELEHIERIGRLCYKSEDKITDDGESAKRFVKMLVDHNHLAMIEHASVAFRVTRATYNELQYAAHLFETYTGQLCQLRFSDVDILRLTVSGNLRAWKELFDLSKEIKLDRLPRTMLSEFDSMPEIFNSEGFDRLIGIGTESSEKVSRDYFAEWMQRHSDTRETDMHCSVSVKFITDRGISHEIVRHRPASFAQESTRYVNYSKDKFGSEIQVIDPFTAIQYDSKMITLDKDLIETMHSNWKEAMESAEEKYMSLITAGATPQIARSVLPNSTKTEIVMTANYAEWKHFFALRTAPAAHPQIRELCIPLAHDLRSILYPLGIQE